MLPAGRQPGIRIGSMQIAVLGIDLGKNSCSVAGMDATGRIVLRRRMQRDSVVKLAAGLPAGSVRIRAKDAGMSNQATHMSCCPVRIWQAGHGGCKEASIFITIAPNLTAPSSGRTYATKSLSGERAWLPRLV
jgi:hypothetical protein